MKFPSNTDFQKGEASNFRVENLATLPTFVPGEDDGRILFVTTGADQGFWFGSSDGTNAFVRAVLGSSISTYTTGVTTIANGSTTQFDLAASTGAPATQGYTHKVEITATTLTSGQCRVEMYEDVARSIKFNEIYFDFNSLTADRLAIGYDLNNVDGTLYVDVTNLSGSAGDIEVTITTAAVIPVTTPPPPGDGSGVNAGVAGEGIDYDAVNGRLDVSVTANKGLELTGVVGSKTIGGKFAPGGGIADSGSGMELDSAVAVVLGTDQNDITSRKAFSQFGLVPAGATGAPVAGTHNAGEFHLDDQNDLYFCTTTGTPGTWIFWGWKEETTTVTTSLSVAAGATATAEIATAGRRGFIRKLIVWGSESAAAAAVDLAAIPFRVVCHPNENREGREQLWSVGGTVRKSYFSAGEAVGQNVLSVNDVDIINLDDLIRVRNTDPDEEFQRVISRDTGAGTITVDETLVNAMATNDHVMFCTELIDLPWRNNSGTPSETNKIFLEFKNDHDTQGLVFGYQAIWENVGG